MDETLARAAVDFGGRPYLVCEADLSNVPLVSLETEGGGSFQTDTFPDFRPRLTTGARGNLHLDILRGRSDHHKMEALFKAAGRAIRDAVAIDPRRNNDIPSTKGTI
jgi:imidazoleglycerol-phosphate dehydratase